MSRCDSFQPRLTPACSLSQSHSLRPLQLPSRRSFAMAPLLSAPSVQQKKPTDPRKRPRVFKKQAGRVEVLVVRRLRLGYTRAQRQSPREQETPRFTTPRHRPNTTLLAPQNPRSRAAEPDPRAKNHNTRRRRPLRGYHILKAQLMTLPLRSRSTPQSEQHHSRPPVPRSRRELQRTGSQRTRA